MATLHLVSHTHWDREWYLTYQQFRIKLVHLLDGLLDLFQKDPDFLYFMLDGQTIVLQDYLQIRPEHRGLLSDLIRSGRLLIGPWYVQPDEFLVSPEAIVRNLLQGDRTARALGPKMEVGYLPDTFGHIGQMPQILLGFGVRTACVWRGLADEPCELWWEAAGGARVFTAYLRDGYGNGASLSLHYPERFQSELGELRDSLQPHSAGSDLLLMLGTDHMEPPPETAEAVGSFRSPRGGEVLVHSSLPNYLAAIQDELAGRERQIPIVRGELRESKKHPLLPGVLSARIWIKQRNEACQVLLEKWAEPWSACTQWGLAQLPDRCTRLARSAGILQEAWRLLLECQPHDSICGTSVDQVYREMGPRFDQVEQIGEEIAEQSLQEIAEGIDTASPDGVGRRPSNAASAVVVFNPVASPTTRAVQAEIDRPDGFEAFDLVDQEGHRAPKQETKGSNRQLIAITLDREGLRNGLRMIVDGRVGTMVVRAVRFEELGAELHVQAIMEDGGQPDLAIWREGQRKLSSYLQRPDLNTFVIEARTAPASQVTFLAEGIPGFGYKTYWIVPKEEDQPRPHSGPVSPILGKALGGVQLLLQTSGLGRVLSAFPRPVPSGVKSQRPPFRMENEFLRVEVSTREATFTLTDKRSGVEYSGLNRFVDGGDKGDLYDYCPPAQDLICARSRFKSAWMQQGPVAQTTYLLLDLPVPVGLSGDRSRRSRERTCLRVEVRAVLTRGVPRVDFQVDVDNMARDHRLRVHFPAPLRAQTVFSEAHFEVVERPLELAPSDESWVEPPRPEKPQRTWSDLNNGSYGLMVANRGLPEIEARDGPDGRSELALTLLRCVGWLSRDDLITRQGPAGFRLAVPEAQLLGPHRFEYSVIPHQGSWETAFPEASAFVAGLRAVGTAIHPGSLLPAASLVQVDDPAFVLSAIKQPEEGEGLVIRGYNITGEPRLVHLTMAFGFDRCWRGRLDERHVQELTKATDHSVAFEVAAHEIVTLIFGD
ncbi:MAG: glycoside hydrolase family 38 C-terminal domain-containing protein [Anaerolineales bacterium]|jgi:alpha-mannosidase